ncbi:MAG: Na/Pi symporter [Phycisphaerae bacterium]|nr:Na/Pi symporter [Phycisphaerae bacterium]
MDRPEKPQSTPSAELAEVTARQRPPEHVWLRAILAVAALLAFVAALKIMGHGLKTIATVPESEAFLTSLFDYVCHPVAGLAVGVLMTSLVQSSSFTTSFTVGLVAAGQISLIHAVPIVMGANIGTSVTNTIASLAYVRRPLNFRRSLSAATVHDFFNLCAVTLLMPFEVAFGAISRPAQAVANAISHWGYFAHDPKKFNLVKMIVKPINEALDWLLMGVLGLSPTVAGAVQAAVAVAILFAALLLLVNLLQGLVKNRLSGLFERTFFRNQGVGLLVGVLLTVCVQSSSVTTSLMVPLVGAGILRLRQVYPYTLGANIGTTMTAMIAALATANAAAVGCAVAHLLFNLMGTAVFWPLQWIPISLAKGYAKLATRRRLIALAYILVLFFALPIIALIAVGTM